MNKKILIIVAAIILLAIAIALGTGFLLSQSRQQTEDAARQDNPIFHTQPEGAECVPDRGDCQAGLTCAAGVCSKP